MTAFQKQVLMKRFQGKGPLENKEKYELAKSLNISEKMVTDWFRRMDRRKKIIP